MGEDALESTPSPMPFKKNKSWLRILHRFDREKKWAFPKKRKEKKKEKKSFNNLIHMFRGAKL